MNTTSRGGIQPSSGLPSSRTETFDHVLAARHAFGRNLRRIRRERGLTQEALSGLCSMTQSYLSEVESAKRNISIDAITTIAGSMGIPIARLFEKAEGPDVEGPACTRESRRPAE